jgi:hypothetical protein
MITGRAGRRLRRSLLLLPLTLLALAARVDTGSAQVPARVAAPYTLMDDGDRLNLEFGAETPLRGNGPFTGYGYFFYTRLIRDHWPSRNSAVGVGVSGGLWAESQVEFRDGRFEKEESFSGHSAGGTFAYYLRGPKIGGLLPLEGQIRANPKYVWYDRTGDTARRFRLPENSAIYDGRAGIRLGGVPPQLFPRNT